MDVTEEDWGIDPLTGNDWGTRQSLEGRRSDQPVIASFLPPVGEAKMISVGPNLEKRLGKLESRKDYSQLARDWLKVCQLANFSDSDTYLDCWKVLWLEMDAFWRDYGYPLEDDRGRSFFRRMPLSYRQIFLWDVAGIEVEALAAELKTTPNNIYVRRHRLADWLVKRGALAALQRHLKQLAEI